MSTNEIIREIAAAARREGIEPAALLAVAELESALRAHAVVDGRHEPLIRFEGHYFDRRLAPEARGRARAAGLASPTAGAIANPASQQARWRMLQAAIAIDRKAALESVSWGLGQVMGSHWEWLGYRDVEALVAAARSGVAGQVELMAAYVRKAGLADALNRRDWQAFARGYNGPGFARNAYDTRLAAAHRRFAADPDVGAAPDELAMGARGEAVRALQSGLSRLGHQLAIDGVFGQLTRAAVAEFQRRAGLPGTGVACQTTLAAMGSPTPPPADAAAPGGLVERLLSLFVAIWRR